MMYAITFSTGLILGMTLGLLLLKARLRSVAKDEEKLLALMLRCMETVEQMEELNARYDKSAHDALMESKESINAPLKGGEEQ